MNVVLQPGITAPQFSLSSTRSESLISLADYAAQQFTILFFPTNPSAALVKQLANYQAKLSDFEAQDTVLIGISPATTEELTRIATEAGLQFPLLSDARPVGEVAGKYGVLSKEGQVLSTVFVIDQEQLVRRVYEPGKYPELPNPAMALRAIKKMADVPKPPPITPDDWQLGPADALITILEYADYECKPCGEAYRLLKQVLSDYDDKVLWVHRHLPLRHSHPLAQQAAEAVEAAGAQGKFWEMHDRLFEAKGALEYEQLVRYAAELGLNVDQFKTDLDNRRFKDAVNTDFKEAVKRKIKVPPALFINGLPLDGPRTETAIRAKIDGMLACIF